MVNVAEQYNSDLARAVAGTERWTALYLPAGIYTLKEPLIFQQRTLLGDGPGKTRIEGTLPGEWLIHSTKNDWTAWQGIGFHNYGTEGHCVKLGRLDWSSIDNCAFAPTNGGLGLESRYGNMGSFRCCSFTFHGQAYTSDGADIRGAASVISCNFVGLRRGLRCYHGHHSVDSCRFEVNRVGLEVGGSPENTNHACYQSTFNNLQLEANDVGINVVNSDRSIIENVNILGTANAPSGHSQIGVRFALVRLSRLDNWTVTGGHSKAAIHVEPNAFHVWGSSASKWLINNVDGADILGDFETNIDVSQRVIVP